MMRTRALLTVSSALLGGCLGDENSNSTEIVHGSLVGQVDQLDGHAYIPAVARIIWDFPGSSAQTLCSGSLVAPNKVLTAAHCLCPRDGQNPAHAFVSFGDSTGHVLPQSWQASWVPAPGAKVCGTWYQLTTDDPIDHSHADVAVLTLVPDASGHLPPITPIHISLDDPALNFGAPSAAHTLTPNFGAAGFGNNFSDEQFSSPDGCVGCDIRRSGILSNNVVLAPNPCSTFPLTSIKDPFPQDCWDGRLWTANGVSRGETLELGHGDSGGPLMFNLNSTSLQETVAGVASSWLPDILGGRGVPFPRHTKWATTGDNAEFLWSALQLPFTRSLAEQRASAVIVTRQSRSSGFASLFINDRAHVVGGLIVAQSFINIGADAVVGDIRARGQVNLRDRAAAGNIVTSSVILTGPGVHTGTQQQGAFQKFEDFDLANAPAAVSTNNTNVVRGQVLSLNSGDHGSVSVFAGGILSLGAGVHTFQNLQLESNSTMTTAAAGITRIFIASTGNVIFRGAVVGPAANTLIGLPRASAIFVGNSINATIVAPNADVDVDMITNAVVTGSYFVKSFELHEGEFLRFAPFSGPWVP